MKNSLLPLIMLVLTFAVVIGCSSDSPTTAPESTPKATVVVDVTPQNVTTIWLLTGPANYTHAGTGDETLANLTPGDYTLTWDDIAGWNSPVPSILTKTVADGGSITFSGTYVLQVGAVTIDAEPNSINAPWQLTGPASYLYDGTGDETLIDLTPGDYTLTWGTVVAWNQPTPDSETQTVTDGTNAAFTGTYALQVGAITLNPEPNDIAAPWQLTGPDGYAHNGTGDETIADLVIGDYTVTWSAVVGWDLPNPDQETQTVVDGADLIMNGNYTELLATIIIDAAPGTISPTWTLTGPAGYTHSGTGDETLSNLTPGNYTLTADATTGYSTPAVETKAVGGGVTTTFVAQYLLETGTGALRLTNLNAGTTGFVRIADDPTLEPQVFTAEAWVTPRGPGYAGVTGLGAIFLGKTAEGATGSCLGSWMMGWSPTTESVWFHVVNTYGSLCVTVQSSPGSVPVDTTVHVSGVFDGSSLVLYVNGVEANTVDFPYTGVYYGSDDLLIGAANFGAGYLRRFDGIIDEVRLWDYALSATDVADRMNCRLDGDEVGLLGYWDFEAGSLVDASGHGHDGVAEEEAGASVTFVDPVVSVSGCR